MIISSHPEQEGRRGGGAPDHCILDFSVGVYHVYGFSVDCSNHLFFSVDCQSVDLGRNVKLLLVSVRMLEQGFSTTCGEAFKHYTL